MHSYFLCAAKRKRKKKKNILLRTRFSLAVQVQCNLILVSQKVDSSPGERHITFLGMP